MVVISTLRAAASGLRCLGSPLTRKPAFKIACNGNNLILSRLGHGGHTMQPLPSRFEWRRWKDQIHFFVALGLVPMGILIFTVNLFHGPCELQEIPEGYEPKHWEYYGHPIERWFARYVYVSPEEIYEKHCSVVNTENQKRILRLNETKVRQMMAERQDVKGWYYIPKQDRRVYVAREFYEDCEKIRGSR